MGLTDGEILDFLRDNRICSENQSFYFRIEYWEDDATDGKVVSFHLKSIYWKEFGRADMSEMVQKLFQLSLSFYISSITVFSPFGYIIRFEASSDGNTNITHEVVESMMSILKGNEWMD